MQPPARNARLTKQMGQPPARKNKVDATGGLTTGDKTTCPLQWTGHGPLRPCANFWCAPSTYSNETETHEDIFEENAQTEGHELKQSNVITSLSFAREATAADLRGLHSHRPAAAMIACPQQRGKENDKTGSRISCSKSGTKATIGGRCTVLRGLLGSQKRATPGPALLAACRCSPGHPSSI